MSFETFEYSKSWRNAGDFATYEQDETQVRDDMQSLYDEVRDFINDKLVALLNTNGAANIATSSGRDIETVLSELDELVTRVAGGTVPEEEAALEWDLNAGGHTITNLADPVDESDAVNRGYMDSTIAAAGRDHLTSVFHYGSEAPVDVRLLWINPTAGMKYYDGTAWVAVPGV